MHAKQVTPTGTPSILRFMTVLPERSISVGEALRVARETRRLEIGPGCNREIAGIVREQFGMRPTVVVADQNTFDVTGRAVWESLRKAGLFTLEPFVFPATGLNAEFQFVQQLEASLRQHEAIPVAVGSGTINDLTKLAAHRVERPYLCVATAASMDGYSAFGASITFHGAKQTFFCPAPVAVIADVDVITKAPGLMNSWGYADLLAKVTAGADWILADALAVEHIDMRAWTIVQGRLREMVADPAGVRVRDAGATARLVEGLMLGGFAMQSAQSSRPASGAEHQFSHLWDMQHHTHEGAAPSHGFKVGIGTLAVTALYEYLLEQPLERLDVEACCGNWPEEPTWRAPVRALLGERDLAAAAVEELRAKHSSRNELRAQLETLRANWPELRERLRAQLLPLAVLKEMLQKAGAPTEPEQIGITRTRLRQSYWQAFCIRRRFTVLDLAVRTRLLDGALETIFGAEGIWPEGVSNADGTQVQSSRAGR
jgi:glycerol-1-phosphate dehydrogenase [NAD(P)+]